MSAWVRTTWCPVPWCTNLGQNSRPTTAQELKGLCDPCNRVVRGKAKASGLATARRRHDRRWPRIAVDLGACDGDGCGAPATTADLDGGAWCKGCAAKAVAA